MIVQRGYDPFGCNVCKQNGTGESYWCGECLCAVLLTFSFLSSCLSIARFDSFVVRILSLHSLRSISSLSQSLANLTLTRAALTRCLTRSNKQADTFCRRFVNLSPLCSSQ